MEKLKIGNMNVSFLSATRYHINGGILLMVIVLLAMIIANSPWGDIIRKSKFPQNPKRSVRFSGKRTKRSVQKRKARNTQKAETKVL